MTCPLTGLSLPCHLLVFLLEPRLAESTYPKAVVSCAWGSTGILGFSLLPPVLFHIPAMDVLSYSLAYAKVRYATSGVARGCICHS